MRSNVASWVSMVLIVGVCIWYRQGPWTPLRVVGFVVGLAALVMLSVARWQLGASFAVRPEAKKLVTTGIYSRIRNPIYISGEVFLLGAALFLPSWIPVVAALVTIPVQVIRARRESVVLRAAFGEEYEAYRRRTWF